LLTLSRRKFVLVLVVAAAGVCAPGCVRRDESPATPVTLRIGVGIPAQGSAASGSRSVVNALRTEPWLTTKSDGHQAERLVTAWEWDPSHTRLRLRIRNDVYFHDGTKLTPQIAAEALRNTARNYSREFAISFASVSDVTVSGEDSVEMHLSEPNQFVLPDLALVSVRLPSKPDIATGPFRLVKQDAQLSELTAFSQYYRGRPSIGQVEVSTYATQRKAWTALMRGEIDMLHEVSLDAAPFVEAETTVNTYSFPRAYYIPLVFNVRHPALRNPEVRKAINEALDKDVLIRQGMKGHGRPADGPIWPEHWAYSAPTRPFEFDPRAAIERMERAGFKVRPGVDGSMPSRFSFTCVFFGEDDRFERFAILVQKQLADVGIDMKLLPLNQKELEAKLAKGEFDAFLFEMFGRSLSWVYEFWRSHEGAHFDNGYRSADLILDRIRGALSDEEVKARVRELADVLHEDPPAAFIAWQTTTRAVSRRFDVGVEEARDILTNVWQWRPAIAEQVPR
jgi:peptide/nickel transport system substrate-binding protein